MNRTGDAGEGEAVAAKGLVGTVVRGAAFAATGYALTQLLTLAAYLLLARLATPEEFGELAAGTIIIGIARLYTESGMVSALIYRRDRVDEAAATATIATFLGGLGFSLIALALAPAVGAFFDSDTVTGVAAAASGLVFLRTVSVVPEALLQRRFSFFRRMIVEPAAVLAFGITATVLTANGLGVWGLLLGAYASASTDALLSWGLVRWRPELRRASFAMWRELIAYGRHTIAATTVIRVSDEIPVALLGRFSGTAVLGQLAYGRRIAAFPLAMVMAAASYVLFPAFARISADRERFHAAVLRALRWMAIVAVPAGLILIPLGEPLAILAFGPVWADAGKAAMALALFTAGRGVTSLISETLKAHGRPDVIVRMNLVELVVAGLAMAALLRFDLIGVCIAISIGVLARGAYAFRRARDVVGLPLGSMLEAIRPPVLAGIAMVAILFPLEALVVEAADRGTGIGLLLLALETGLGIAAYSAAIHIIVPGALTELIGLLRSIRRSPSEIAEGDREVAEVASERA